ncbi:hypothetical protein LY76DRAFT_287624 [Colletotrichum caudatum]|nr:hypothetical protein LY76DRAFT_287624 [Colletotrichum caudatum]
MDVTAHKCDTNESLAIHTYPYLSHSPRLSPATSNASPGGSSPLPAFVFSSPTRPEALAVAASQQNHASGSFARSLAPPLSRSAMGAT